MCSETCWNLVWWVVVARVEGEGLIEGGAVWLRGGACWLHLVHDHVHARDCVHGVLFEMRAGLRCALSITTHIANSSDCASACLTSSSCNAVLPQGSLPGSCTQGFIDGT
jgi:hypothetical protein